MEIKQFLIDENATILDAMERLNTVAKKVLFVMRDNQFVAIVTDGDIRRWILQKGSLEAGIKYAANYDPIYLLEQDKVSAMGLIKSNSIEAVPILNKDKQIVSIVLWTDEEVHHEHSLDIPVVIMAGGLGKRLYPYTNILPKPLIPIGDIPITEHIMNRFHRFGVNRFHLIVNHKKNMIKAYFNEIEKDYDIVYIDEEKSLGTGGGLSLLKGKINSTFILSNCDILIEEDYEKIYAHHVKEKNVITIVCSMKSIQIPYGVIEIDQTGQIENMREKPSHFILVNTGMYFVEPEVINDMTPDETADFPDIIENYRASGQKVGVYPISENSWLDMGQFDEMEKMKSKLALEC